MPIDPYSPCPGGTGKKIKFCCADLQTELDKIQRMLEGDQRAACLEHIESIEGKYPDRACLLSIKAMLQGQLGSEEKAASTVAHFVEKFPDNPVALAEKATLEAAQQDAAAAIVVLQDALEKCTDQIPTAVYDAIGAISQALLSENHLLAARAHLALQIGMAGGKDERPMSLLIQLNNSSRLPLLAKQDFALWPAPDDALWKAAFATAMEPALRGAWRLSVKNLTELAAKVGDWPAIWHNIAVLRSWLADTSGAIQAWRKFAEQDVPLDDKVEAEALAQLLDAESVDLVDLVIVTYPVTDAEACQARLMASPRAPQMPLDLSRLGSDDEPPPKGAWWLVDREIPASGKELTFDQVPMIVGHALLYGKQTDRDARLELVAYRTELMQAQSTVRNVAGDALGAAGAAEVESQTAAVQHLLSWNWRLPDDTPPEKRLALIDAKRADALVNQWTTLPQKVFGGKSPSQAAADEKSRVRVLASILLLELATQQSGSTFDFNRLREKLALPTLATIDPKSGRLADVGLARLARLEVEQLSDEQLVQFYQAADHFRHIAAIKKLAHEVIARENLDAKLDKAEVYGILAQIEADTDRALEYLELARKTAEKNKKSTAPWDLAELALRIARGDVAQADRLLTHIRNDHLREPGVAQALFQILAEAGIIGPDGRPTAAAAAAAGAGPEAPGFVVPGAAAAEPGKIWTPGGEQTSGAKKSGLWTPDMD
ncbi:MAG: hypothetical protein WD845_14420 [Pirellulales bacterium]